MAEEKDKQKKRSQNSSTDISDTIFKAFEDPEAGKSADLEDALLKIDTQTAKLAAWIDSNLGKAWLSNLDSNLGKAWLSNLTKTLKVSRELASKLRE